MIEKSNYFPAKRGETFHLDLFLVNKNIFNEYLNNKGLKNIYDRIKDIYILAKYNEFTNIEKKQFLKNHIIQTRRIKQ